MPELAPVMMATLSVRSASWGICSLGRRRPMRITERAVIPSR